MQLWSIVWYIAYTSISVIYKKYQTIQKNNGNKNNKKTFKIKMKDAGMSKPKEHVNKFGIVITPQVNIGPKIKQTTST